MKAIKRQRSAQDQKPNAWIVNPNDRGRKSIKKDSKIYLKDGQNFEIELFNPLKDSVLSEIKVNGKSVSSTGLVLRPGERFYLDCFVDDKKKFVFKTYTVENTDESKEAIVENGYVEVFFYKEETLQIQNWRQKFTPIVERHYYPVWYPWYQPYWYGTVTIGQPIYGGGRITTSGTTTTNLTLNSTSTAIYSANSGVVSYSYTSNGANSLIGGVNYQSIETGRIEKGESSSQQFTEIDMQFENLHISSIVYQLLPESQKPVETREIKNEEITNFCSNCGRKLSGGENFCPQCGRKLTTTDVVLV